MALLYEFEVVRKWLEPRNLGHLQREPKIGIELAEGSAQHRVYFGARRLGLV